MPLLADEGEEWLMTGVRGPDMRRREWLSDGWREGCEGMAERWLWEGPLLADEGEEWLIQGVRDVLEATTFMR